MKHEILAAHELTVTDAAKALGVTRPALSALLNVHADLSPEMALRLEMAFGVSMDVLMRMQNSYDIVRARKGAKGIKVRRFERAAAGQMNLVRLNHKAFRLTQLLVLRNKTYV